MNKYLLFVLEIIISVSSSLEKYISDNAVLLRIVDFDRFVRGLENEMRLILCRHGNTFTPGEPAVWLGADDDPPLTVEGAGQSRRLGDALVGARIVPCAIFCGPLLRMYAFAEILSARMNLDAPPVVDQRLSEIDHGCWNGLSNEEVVERFGGRDFYDWYERNIWPSSGWASAETDFHGAVRRFIHDVGGKYDAEQTVIAITGHGVLKCLGLQMRKKAEAGLPRGWHRVDTGNICDLICGGDRIRAVSWNERPDLALGRALAI